MALANYTDLQASIASWLNRADQAANIPDFVALAESSINSDLRLRDMLSVTTLATNGNTALPADWLSFAWVSYQGNQLSYVTPEQFRAEDRPVGTFSIYSIEGNRILIDSGAITLDIAYYARLPALSVTAMNAVLTKYPQIYLSKSLAWGFGFLMDEAKAMQWETVYQKSIAVAKTDTNASLFSGAQLRVRVR